MMFDGFSRLKMAKCVWKRVRFVYRFIVYLGHMRLSDYLAAKCQFHLLSASGFSLSVCSINRYKADSFQRTILHGFVNEICIHGCFIALDNSPIDNVRKANPKIDTENGHSHLPTVDVIFESIKWLYNLWSKSIKHFANFLHEIRWHANSLPCQMSNCLISVLRKSNCRKKA